MVRRRYVDGEEVAPKLNSDEVLREQTDFKKERPTLQHMVESCEHSTAAFARVPSRGSERGSGTLLGGAGSTTKFLQEINDGIPVSTRHNMTSVCPRTLPRTSVRSLRLKDGVQCSLLGLRLRHGAWSRREADADWWRGREDFAGSSFSFHRVVVAPREKVLLSCSLQTRLPTIPPPFTRNQMRTLAYDFHRSTSSSCCACRTHQPLQCTVSGDRHDHLCVGSHRPRANLVKE